MKRSTSKNEEKKADREELIVHHAEYIKIAEAYVCKAELTIEAVKSDIE